jgi:hypothetical protein
MTSNPLVYAQPRDAIADRFNRPSRVAAEDTGQLRQQWINARADIGIDRIHTGGLDPNDGLARSGSGIGLFLKPHHTGIVPRADDDCLHVIQQFAL